MESDFFRHESCGGTLLCVLVAREVAAFIALIGARISWIWVDNGTITSDRMREIVLELGCLWV